MLDACVARDDRRVMALLVSKQYLPSHESLLTTATVAGSPLTLESNSCICANKGQRNFLLGESQRMQLAFIASF
jgi:hypothetical protein